ncbi:hypothetical protein EOG74_25080 [Salmonella enterica]|nr:hypothetical protein [Salmonella enterica]ECC1663340.1 hypothetical protein [Salmonella enterica subsp. diarizonae]EAZ5905937.1 hypothetical protein [Salmonella enterica]EEL2876089.1 hypothetical protein [Salmonella enterica]EHE9225773.1 hypothetical protein [Salmonella enterica]
MDELVNDGGEYPDFYPAEPSLPPNNSVDTEGGFYRLVRAAPPTPECFLSTHEENPNRHKRCFTIEDKECVYGTSFWGSKDAVLKKQEALPEALGDRILAFGILDKTMGKMKQTLEAEHFTVWFKKNIIIHTSFQEVK